MLKYVFPFEDIRNRKNDEAKMIESMGNSWKRTKTVSKEKIKRTCLLWRLKTVKDIKGDENKLRVVLEAKANSWGKQGRKRNRTIQIIISYSMGY